jgi:hypothetical protein
MRKKLALVLGGVLAILVVAAGVALVLVDVNSYRGEIEARLEAELGREVTLGEMSLGLLPPRFRVDSTAISEAPGFGDHPAFITADRLAVRVGLLGLLSGDVRIDSLELEGPSVELVRNAGGEWNFSTLGNPGREENREAEQGPPGPAAPPRFELRRLTVRDGRVGVTDLGRGNERTVYDHIDLTIVDFAPGRPFSFDIAAHLPGEGTQELDLTGTVGPLDLGTPRATPVTGSLTLREVGLDGLRAFLHSDTLPSANGSLSGETTIENTNGTVAAAGRLVLDRARFEDLDLGFPVALDYDAVADLPGKLLTINSSAVRLGDTPIALAGTIDTGQDPAILDLGITSDDVSVAEVARMASAFGVAFPPDVQVEGRTGINLRATGAASDPRLDGTIAGRELRISGERVPVPVEVDVIDVVLTPTTIRANDFEVRAGETTATARFVVTGYTSENPTIDTSLEARDATLEEIQSITRAYGVAGLEQIEGTGTLDLNLQASGPLESVRSESIARSLDGNLALDFNPLRILGFNAAGQLGSLVGFDDGSTSEDLTEILTLTGNVNVIDGIARTQDLVARLTIGEVAAAGTADLAAETLDLRLATVFSKEFSDRVRETGVGGYLDTAFANTAGELVLPVRVTGGFADPRFAPDAEALARMQLERAVQDPAGFLGALLGRGVDAGNESEDPDGAEEPENRPVDRIRGILGGLLGGDPNQED